MKKIIRLTESDLHRIIENSVRRVINEGLSRRGYISPDGNHMTGGYYGSETVSGTKDIMDELLDKLTDVVSEEEFDSFAHYCEQNPNVFVINATMSSSYDESTGYGSSYAPIIELQNISGEKEALEYISKYPNKQVAQVAVQTLKEILDGLTEDDFDIEDDCQLPTN